MLHLAVISSIFLVPILAGSIQCPPNYVQTTILDKPVCQMTQCPTNYKQSVVMGRLCPPIQATPTCPEGFVLTVSNGEQMCYVQNCPAGYKAIQGTEFHYCVPLALPH